MPEAGNNNNKEDKEEKKFLHIKGSTRSPCGPRKSRVFVTVVFVFSCIIVVAALASCSNPASRLQRVNWEDSAEEAHNWDGWEDEVREGVKKEFF